MAHWCWRTLLEGVGWPQWVKSTNCWVEKSHLKKESPCLWVWRRRFSLVPSVGKALNNPASNEDNVYRDPLQYQGFPGGSEVKASAWNEGDLGSIPGSGRFPWRRKWQPTPVLLPGESHGGRSLVGYSPWGCKESHTIERLHFTPVSQGRAKKREFGAVRQSVNNWPTKRLMHICPSCFSSPQHKKSTGL